MPGPESDSTSQRCFKQRNAKLTAPIVKKHIGVFEGLGQLSPEHNIHLLPGATPVVHAARRVPFHLRGRVEEQLLWTSAWS